MEKSFADLWSDAFPETSVPSFPESEDLDYESLDFKDDGTVLNQDNTVDQEEGSPLLQTAICINDDKQETFDAKYNSREDHTSSEDETEEKLGDFLGMIYCSNDSEEVYAMGEDLAQTDNNQNQNQDMTILIQENNEHQEEISPILETFTCIYNDDEETSDATNMQNVEVSLRQEDCQSSEEECGENEGEIKEKPGDFLGTAHCSDDDEEAMEQALAQNYKAQISNQEEGESNFENVPGDEHSLSEEEDQGQDTTKTMFFQVEYTLKYPEISYDSTEELLDDEDNDTDDDDDDDDVDKMEDFSGEEHQEAGECFADYPSDFSSCEYADNTRNVQESNFESQLDCMADDLDTTELKSTEKVELEGMFLNNEVVNACIDEDNIEKGSKLYSYAKDDLDEMEMANQDFKSLQFPENQDNNPLQSWTADVFSKWSTAEEATKILNPDTTDDSVSWELDTTTPLKSENTEKLLSNAHRDDGNDAKSSTETQEGQTTVSSSLGSVDDSFFFKGYEVSEATEDWQMEDDTEEKKWEQERIQAFYKFYDDKDGDSGREERQIKVQFCTEALSQVIHYDTDSSDRDSLSSSLDEDEDEEEDEEEDEHEDEGKKDTDLNLTYDIEECPSIGSADEVELSSKESQSVEDVPQVDCDSQNTSEISQKESKSTNKPICNRKDRCPSVLRIILSLFLVVVMGLVMFWWVTDAEEWPAFV